MKIKLIDTPLHDLKIVAIELYVDKRGFFIETWHKKDFAKVGINFEFVQDSHSRSKKNVIRGLHYQNQAALMPKLVRCSFGRAFMVAVDIRLSSPTLGKWFTLELSDKNQKQLFVPAGFALGSAALSEIVDLCYKQGNYYTPSAQGVIAWDDKGLDIKWPIIKNPIISKSDQLGISFKQYLENPAFK